MDYEGASLHNKWVMYSTVIVFAQSNFREFIEWGTSKILLSL